MKKFDIFEKQYLNDKLSAIYFILKEEDKLDIEIRETKKSNQIELDDNKEIIIYYKDKFVDSFDYDDLFRYSTPSLIELILLEIANYYS